MCLDYANNLAKKLSVLARLHNFMSLKQRRVLIKSFFESEFGYRPLRWMYHGRGINNKVNHLHERSLRITCKDSHSCFRDLLKTRALLILETFKTFHRIT